MQANKQSFAQKNPVLFGFLIMGAALVLILGAMAALRAMFSAGHSGSMFGSDRLGIVNIEGPIFESRAISDWIAELRDDDSVLGVLVRVDSPGGGVAPSQEIFRAMERLAKEKPVVVSMGSVAASGGYYVSCPAHTIIANPGTITGSIGVKMEILQFMNLMETVGLDQQTLVSGKFKNVPTPFEEMTDEEQEYLQSIVTDLFDQFVSDVAKKRNLDPTHVQHIADGRILTGRQALDEGLVDGVGSFDDAMEVLKQMCNVTGKIQALEGPRKEETMFPGLMSSVAEEIATAMMQTLREQLSISSQPDFSYR